MQASEELAKLLQGTQKAQGETEYSNGLHADSSGSGQIRPDACERMRGHANACECMRMHANACECMRILVCEAVSTADPTKARKAYRTVIRSRTQSPDPPPPQRPPQMLPLWLCGTHEAIAAAEPWSDSPIVIPR